MMLRALTSPRPWIVIGAVICGTAVALGAYGWHDLENDAEARAVFMLAVQYQMWHGLALFVVAWRTCENGKPASIAAVAGACFTAGVLLFSGNLYVFALTGDVPVIGAAPMGGITFMTGWALVGVSAVLKTRKAVP